MRNTFYTLLSIQFLVTFALMLMGSFLAVDISKGIFDQMGIKGTGVNSNYIGPMFAILNLIVLLLQIKFKFIT